MKFWEAKDCIFDIWRQSQSHDCRCEKLPFCSYLALICLSKNLWGNNFYKKKFNCRQLLAPVVGLAEEEAEVGVCEVGSTLLDRGCDLSLWGACGCGELDCGCAFSILVIMIVLVVIVMYRMVLFYCSSHNMCKWWKESILFDCVNKKCSSSSSSCESGIRLIGGRRKKLWGEWKEYLHFLLNVFIGYKYIIGSKDFICWQFFLCLGISFYLFKVLHLFCEGGSNREASPTAELNFTWVVEDFRNQVKRFSSSSK